MDKQTDIVTDIATYRLNWPRGRCSEKVFISVAIRWQLKEFQATKINMVRKGFFPGNIVLL